MSEGRFSGLPVVLGASAAAVATVGGLLGIFFQLGVFGGDKAQPTAARPTAGRSMIDQPTKADWAAQANRICEKANDDIDALPEPETLDPSELAGAGGEAVDIGQRQLRQLQKLRPPRDAGPKVQRLLRIYAQQNDASEEIVAALRIADVTSIQQQIDTITLQDRALKRLGRAGDNLANQLGATTCAEGASFVGTGLGR